MHLMELPEEMLSRIADWATRSSLSTHYAASPPDRGFHADMFDSRDREARDMGLRLSLTCKTLKAIAVRHVAEFVVLRGECSITRFHEKLVGGHVNGRYVRELCIVYAEPTGWKWKCSRLPRIYSTLTKIMQQCDNLETLDMCNFMQQLEASTCALAHSECTTFWRSVPSTVKTIGISSNQHLPFIAVPNTEELSKFLERHIRLESWCIQFVSGRLTATMVERVLQTSKAVNIGMLGPSDCNHAWPLPKVEAIQVNVESAVHIWGVSRPQLKHIRLHYAPSRVELTALFKSNPALQTLHHHLHVASYDSRSRRLWEIGSVVTPLQELTLSFDPQTVFHPAWLNLVRPLRKSSVPAWDLHPGTDEEEEMFHGREDPLELKALVIRRLCELVVSFNALVSKTHYPHLKKLTIYCSVYPCFPYPEHQDMVTQAVREIAEVCLQKSQIELAVISGMCPFCCSPPAVPDRSAVGPP